MFLPLAATREESRRLPKDVSKPWHLSAGIGRDFSPTQHPHNGRIRGFSHRETGRGIGGSNWLKTAIRGVGRWPTNRLLLSSAQFWGRAQRKVRAFPSGSGSNGSEGPRLGSALYTCDQEHLVANWLISEYRLEEEAMRLVILAAASVLIVGPAGAQDKAT
jgi:hypothetical protein